MINGNFKKTHDFAKRKQVAQRIVQKYPDRVPVIVESSKSSNPTIDKAKFLVPMDITVGKFICEIRKHIREINPQHAIFLFMNGVLPPTAALMSQMYEKHKDLDGFLYFVYALENSFGN